MTTVATEQEVCWREVHESVHDAENWGTAVVFAVTEDEAMAAVSRWHGWAKDEPPHGVVREPQFDHYHEQGHVPNEALLDAGWWFHCVECGCRVTDEGKEDEDTGEFTPLVIDHDDVFCSKNCRDSLRASQAENKRKKMAALTAFERRTGDITDVTDNYSTMDGGRVRFLIPFGIVHGEFRWSDAEPDGSFWVNPFDLKRFRSLAATWRRQRIAEQYDLGGEG